MKDLDYKIHLLLDAELPPAEARALREELLKDPLARAKLLALERVVYAVQELPRPRLDEAFAHRITARIWAQEGYPSFWGRMKAWLFTPRLLQWNPAAAAALGGLVLLGFFYAWSTRGPGPQAPITLTTLPTRAVEVRFFLVAPGAQSVAVAGDFTNWSPTQIYLADPDGDGIWTGTVALQPGLHQYMFVVDGTRWVPDPSAQTYVDDGFGSRNAVLKL